jgi:hypothetical protein
MRITLPTKKGTPNANPELEFKQLVVVGANGAGKTRFGAWIEQNNINITVHRVSAQKSLSIPDFVSTKSKKIAEKEFLYGSWSEGNPGYYESIQGKTGSRWGNKINTFLLDDYEKLMILLHTEEYEQSLNYKENGGSKPNTKLDRIQKIWEQVLPHRKFKKKAGVIDTYPTGQETKTYNASEMSDGERVIFYLAGQVVCAPENSLIIIDEPEMHIHASLIKKLFDLIEVERPDCAIVYLTHSIDFAFSRQDATKIWAKSYENEVWDYEILNDEMPIPEQLYLEILGSRNPVIFIEGDNSSIDYEIYNQIYPNHTLKPLGSCEKVVQITKAFREQLTFHNIESIGIIDRDRRTQTDIDKLTQNGIWILDVAEAENLLLLEDIVKAVASHMGKDPGNVFSTVKQNLITFFQSQLDAQILLHFKEVLKRKLLELINFGAKNISATIVEIDTTYSAIDKQALFDAIKADFDIILHTQDYEGILRVFNLKNALIPNSKVCEETGVKNKEEFRKLVITLLKKNDVTSNVIRQKIDSKIIKS